MTTRPRGPLPSWRPTTARQKAILADLVRRFEQHQAEDTLPRSGRGVFYDLRPAGMGNGITYTKHPPKLPNGRYDPMTANPQVVQDVLVLARRAGIIPESWVADARAPQPISDRFYDDADDFARLVAEEARSFRLDLQRDQDRHVEVWCEAEDLAPRLARVAGPYGVPVYSGGGYGGLKGKRQLAARAAGRPVPTVVLVVTDLDDDGRDIYRSAAEDATAWVTGHHSRPAGWLSFERIAITEDQAREEGVLDEDGKAEADALPVPVMDAILLGWLDRLQDPAGRESLLVDQDQERARLPDAIRAALTDDEGSTP
jgi:hypothetical protein